ncbi:MAG: hypothetical protein P0120_11160 [Nitrospira sp.]|nr:hypothetical protein [Nitrospira sp.]
MKISSGMHRRFCDAMTLWLQQNKYQIGCVPSDVNLTTNKVAKAIKLGFKLVRTLTNGTPSLDWNEALTWSGASVEEITNALKPFTSISDLIGYHLGWNDNSLLLVLLADELSQGETSQRFDELFELAKPLQPLGLHVRGQAPEAIVQPLLVYFDKAKYVEKVPMLFPAGWKYSYWRRTILRPAYINVTERTILWTDPRGFAKAGYTLMEMFGAKMDPFSTQDLHSVLDSMA